MMEPAELRAKLQGAMVFAPTPLQARSLDLEGFRDNLDYLAQNGMPWIAVAGFVGEYSAR